MVSSHPPSTCVHVCLCVHLGQVHTPSVIVETVIHPPPREQTCSDLWQSMCDHGGGSDPFWFMDTYRWQLRTYGGSVRKDHCRWRVRLERVPSKFFFFFNVYLVLRQRETEHERGRGRERGRHRIRSRLQALSHQPRARRGARTHGP